MLPYGSELGISDPQVFYSICEDLRVYPAFWLYFVLTWQELDVLEASRIFSLSNDKGSFSSVALAVHIPVSLTLLCLPALHFFLFNSQVLIDSE